MADNNQPNTKPPAVPAKTSGVVRVDLYNPTPARRIVYDGIENSQKPITLDPGETKRNVEISDKLAKELKGRTRPRGKEKADLLVYEAGKAPDPSKPDVDDEDDEDEE
jgi:hypothetical protein